MQMLQGVVQKGHSRGKKLGFPTINLTITKPMEEGIYCSHIVIDDEQYNALTFIGPAKTFGETESFAETYVIAFSEEVYGKSVSVTLLKKIRDNQKFDSEKKLIEQMEKDKEEAIIYFSTVSE